MWAYPTNDVEKNSPVYTEHRCYADQNVFIARIRFQQAIVEFYFENWKKQRKSWYFLKDIPLNDKPRCLQRQNKKLFEHFKLHCNIEY